MNRLRAASALFGIILSLTHPSVTSAAQVSNPNVSDAPAAGISSSPRPNASLAPNTSPGAHHFPQISATSLAGKHFALPSDFDTPLDVVIVTFKREQQEAADSWRPFVADLRRRVPNLHVYLLITLPKNYAIARGIIESQIRAGIPDEPTRASTLALYVDKHAFDTALGITDENDAQIFVIKPTGEVIWQGSGAFDSRHAPNVDAIFASAP